MVNPDALAMDAKANAAMLDRDNLVLGLNMFLSLLSGQGIMIY